MKTKISRFAGMWLHRGFNYIKHIVIRVWNSIISGAIYPICSFFSKQKLSKIVDKFGLYCLVFVIGIIVGQNLLMNKITDDCRILRATRFGEVYIGCGTAQKL